MMKTRMIYAGGLMAIAIGGLFCLGSQPANAQIKYGWMDTPTTNKIINRPSVALEEINDGYLGCERNSKIEVAVARKVGFESIEKSVLSGACASNQPGGSTAYVSGYNYVRFGQIGSYVKSNISGIFRFAGHRALRSEANEAPWATTGLRVYETPVFQMFETVMYNGALVTREKPVWGSDDKSWHIMNPRNNVGLSVRSSEMSPNGKWLVVESGDFWRVNLETREMLQFSSPILSYGYGLDPSYKYAVSDDGTKVLIYGGSRDDRIVKLYDLTDCKPDKFDGKQIAEGCKSRDIRPLLGLDSSNGIMSAILSTSGDRLMYTAKDSALYKEYIAYPQGVAQFGLEYLALGDSFTSGEGDGDGAKYYIPGTDGDGGGIARFQTGIENYPYEKEKCHISQRSYPFRIASLSSLSRGSNFESVACSGADVNDVINDRSSGEPSEIYNGNYDHLKFLEYSSLLDLKNSSIIKLVPGRASQTELVSKYQPKVLTIGIGGNNLAFADKMKACVTSKSTCDYTTTRRAETAYEIKNNAFTELDKAYKKLKRDSPSSHIYAIGYPQMFMSSGSCDTNVFRLDQDEREYIIFSIQYLNKIIKAAATKNGVQYIDIEYSLAGKNLCSGIDQPYVNGITKGNDQFLIGNESFHPNEKGHDSIALKILDTVNYALLTPLPMIVDNTIVTPEPPKYFGTFNGIISKQKILNIQKNAYPKNLSLPISTKRAPFQFVPGSVVGATIHSEPIFLGTLTVGLDGSATGSVEVPSNVSAGYHELHITGQLASGENVTMYEPIFVAESETDYDGDGILNVDDPCPVVDPSGEDRDVDGVDDACDGVIGEKPQLPIENTNSSQSSNSSVNETDLTKMPVKQVDAGSVPRNPKVKISDDPELNWLEHPLISMAINLSPSTAVTKEVSPSSQDTVNQNSKQTNQTNGEASWAWALPMGLFIIISAGYIFKKIH